MFERRRPALILAALVGVSLGASLVGLSLGACKPERRPVTQADIDAFLAEKQMTRQVGEWRFYLATRRPDSPRPLQFPSVTILDPPMWDYVEHAVLRREKRAWFWDNGLRGDLYVSTSNTSATGNVLYSTCTWQPLATTTQIWISEYPNDPLRRELGSPRRGASQRAGDPLSRQ